MENSVEIGRVLPWFTSLHLEGEREIDSPKSSHRNTTSYPLEDIRAEVVDGRPRLHQVEHPHCMEVLPHRVL